MLCGRLVRQNPWLLLRAVLRDWVLQLLHWFGTTDPRTAPMMHPVDWAQVHEAVKLEKKSNMNQFNFGEPKKYASTCVMHHAKEVAHFMCSGTGNC